MSAENPSLFILLPLIYVIPSNILYVLIIIVMRKNQLFSNTSFYTVFVVYAVNNMTMSFCYFLTYRGPYAWDLLPFYHSLPESGFVITFFMYLTYCSGAAGVLLDVCMCFNRFTVIWLKSRHNSFWRGFGVLFLFLAILIACAINFQVWITKVKIYPCPPPNICYKWAPTDMSAVPWMNVSIITASNVSITAILSFLMNCRVGLYLLQTKVGTSHEYRLFIFSLFIFLNHIVQFILQMIFFFAPFERGVLSIPVRIQFFVIDMTTLSSPWFLLWMSQSIRSQIKGLFWKTQVKSQTVSIISPQRQPTAIPVSQVF